MSILKRKILVFCDYYLPGFKSGGGMWTVVNLVERFSDRYDFYVVSKNHDGKADLTPYAAIETGKWYASGSVQTLYLKPGEFSSQKVRSLVANVAPDAIVLNSTFSTSAIAVLHARLRGAIKSIPLVLLATGELSKPGLALKPIKKWLFLRYAKLIGLHRGIIWKASFDIERDEIREAISRNAEIWVAPDLPPKDVLADFDPADKPPKRPGAVRFTFVSRIVRKKNLHFFLDLLRDSAGDIDFEILGPPEDVAYWEECRRSIAELPPNIQVQVTGAVSNDEILKRLCGSHFFVLPTLNENFGYVFIEAMAAGCPLVISDRTIWREIQAHNAGWIIPLEDESGWRSVIEECLSMPQNAFDERSSAARQYAVGWLADPVHEEATAKVLERAVKGGR